MAISRMQEPRQLYGLGSLVKSIGKGVKKFVKSPLGKAAILGVGAFGLPGTTFGGLFGRAAIGGKATGLLGKAGIQAALPSLFGVPGVPDAVGKEGIFSNFFSKLGTAGKLGIGTSIATYLLSQGKSKEEVEAITQDKGALSGYLRDYYTKLNPGADETEIQEFIETNTSEYATGGRVGFNKGSGEVSGTFGVLSENADISKIIDQKVTDYENEYMKKTGELPPEFYGDKYRMQLQKEYLMEKKANGGRIGLKDSVKFMTEKELEETMPGLARGEVKNYELKKKANRMENIMKLLKEYEKNKKAAGGRIGYAEGTPEGGEGKQFLLNKKYLELLKKYSEAGLSNADSKALKEANEFVRKIKLAAGGMPTGIMRANQAGVIERDYRDEGGFVPVGIKERADDVPAMLSKNEFVMTADAVRGAGDGSIEKGAQRMYDQMKNLESKVA